MIASGRVGRVAVRIPSARVVLGVSKGLPGSGAARFCRRVVLGSSKAPRRKAPGTRAFRRALALPARVMGPGSGFRGLPSHEARPRKAVAHSTRAATARCASKGPKGDQVSAARRLPRTRGLPELFERTVPGLPDRHRRSLSRRLPRSGASRTGRPQGRLFARIGSVPTRRWVCGR